MVVPPYLKKGQTIGITCPAGYMDAQKAQTCINTLQGWGFEVMLGKTLGSRSKNYFSGTDEERRDEKRRDEEQNTNTWRRREVIQPAGGCSSP